MKLYFRIFLLFSTAAIINSCMQSVSRKIGSCYIQEGEEIMYLKMNSTGDIDSLVLKDANAAFFEVIHDDIPGDECVNGNIWAKDKLNVWYKNKKIKGADPETFTVLENGYAKDKNYAYFNDILLSGSNVSYFKVQSYFFAKDNEMVWYLGNEVFGVKDPLGFVIIDGYFSKDGDNIYFNNDTMLIKMPDSDVSTFRCFDKNVNLEKNSLKYYVDKNKVYCIDTEKNVNDKDFLYVFEAFIESFKVMPDTNFSKDNFNAYYKSQIVKSADPFSFMTLGNDYSKDNTNIYFKNKKMNGADYNTFKVFKESNGFDARDSVNYFLKGKKVRANF